MRRTFGIFVFLSATLLVGMGQDILDGFVARIYRSESGAAMPYRLFIPAGYDKAKTYPLVIWLHGGAGSGADNVKQLMGDQIAGTRAWTSAKNQEEHPAFVVVPQAPRCWDVTGYPFRSPCNGVVPRGTELSPELLQVTGILKSLEAEFNIDARRIYIAGQSIGAFGTWNFVTKRPDLFAAAIPISGGGNPALAARAKNVPIWSFQGASDNAEFVASNRRMIAALRKAGATPRYTEYPRAGHDIWERVFNESDLIDWMFAQHQ